MIRPARPARRVLAHALLVLALAGCSTSALPSAASPAASSPSESPTEPGPTPLQSPNASVISVPGWGELWASLPAWFALPADAVVVPTTSESISYKTSAAPAAAVAFVDEVIRPRGFSAESRDRQAGLEQAFYTWDNDDACETLVVARAVEGATRVDIRYPTSCPP